MPCSLTPAGPITPSLDSVSARPPCSRERRLAAGLHLSGLNGRRWRWLSTLRSAAHTAPRKTRFRLLARLYRVGLVAHKASTKGFRGNRYISSSLPKLFLGAIRNSLTQGLTTQGVKLLGQLFCVPSGRSKHNQINT